MPSQHFEVCQFNNLTILQSHYFATLYYYIPKIFPFFPSVQKNLSRTVLLRLSTIPASTLLEKCTQTIAAITNGPCWQSTFRRMLLWEPSCKDHSPGPNVDVASGENPLISPIFPYDSVLWVLFQSDVPEVCVYMFGKDIACTFCF